MHRSTASMTPEMTLSFRSSTDTRCPFRHSNTTSKLRGGFSLGIAAWSGTGTQHRRYRRSEGARLGQQGCCWLVARQLMAQLGFGAHFLPHQHGRHVSRSIREREALNKVKHIDAAPRDPAAPSR